MMNQPIQQLQNQIIEEENTIDLAKYFRFIFDNRWLIAGIALAVTLAGVAYALIATPIYKANILIKVDDNFGRPKSAPGDLMSAETIPDVKAAVASEIEVLRSRAVVARAVDNGRFYINIKPKYFPAIGRWIARQNKKLSEPGILGFGGYVWGSEQARISVFNVPEALEGKEFILTAEGKEKFRLQNEDFAISLSGRVGEAIKVGAVGGTIELVVEQLAAEPGAQFLVTRSARLDAVERLQEGLKISQKGKQSGVIEVALEGADRTRTSRILDEIGKAYMTQNVDRKSEEAEKALAFLNTQLPELKRELESAESKYNQVRNTRGTVDVAEETKTVLQQSLLTQTKIVELNQKRDELLMRFLPEHPMVQNIDQQIQGLNKELARIDTKIKKLPDTEQNVQRLNRDVKINTELYTALLSAAQQLRVATESKIGSARLLDNAVIPLKPVRPKPLIVIALSAMAGLTLGVVAAYFRKMAYGRIDAPREIETLLGLPVTATIPHSVRQEKLYARLQHDKKAPAMLPLDVPSDVTVESLRHFRASLQFAMAEARNNIVMIVGPTAGVGKSFVSANFAAVLASIGKKVLLIDGDLRFGHLHEYFGVERGTGLADVITGKVMFGHAIRKDVAENVDFLSSGEMTRNPAELLAHDNFGKLLQLLSARYDFILIDTPPLLAVSDPLIIAAHAGAIFNVVRGGQTTASEVEEVVKRLNQAGHSVTGVVFNDVKHRPTYGYGNAYGKYAY